MLDKLLIHLKNIIFFKLIVYLLLIVILALIIPIFIQDLEKASIKKSQASSFLQETTLKIQSISNFEAKLATLNNNYKNLITSDSLYFCKEKIKFVNYVKQVTEEYELFEPLEITLSKGFEGQDYFPEHGHIKIAYYTLDINFKANDLYSFLSIIKEIYDSLPFGSVIVSSSLKRIEPLTPKIIDKLSVEKAPQLLESRNRILLRDIIYEK